MQLLDDRLGLQLANRNRFGDHLAVELSGFDWKVYGGEGDTWGAMWTPADIDATSFGLQIAAHNDYGGGVATAYIDAVEIRVFYCE